MLEFVETWRRHPGKRYTTDEKKLQLQLSCKLKRLKRAGAPSSPPSHALPKRRNPGPPIGGRNAT